MKLDLTDMLFALSFALDKAESEVLGVDTGHCRRVSYIALLMAQEAGFREEELRDFIGCCLLHDNALSEYIREELSDSVVLQNLPVKRSGLTESKMDVIHHHHCVVGEQNIRFLPFHTDVKDVILYHHENADGSGVLGQTAAETPLKSQILHLADMMDITSQLPSMTATEFETFCTWVRNQTGRLFSEQVTELFFQAVSFDKIANLKDRQILSYLRENLRTAVVDYSNEEIRDLAGMFAKIVDYKSTFTQTHSRGVAEKAETMARYYGFDDEKTIRYYFAGAMHDIGKLVISNDILEKAGKLTNDEFAEMKRHAAATYQILSQVKDIPDIVRWASNHHEKLNGTGYPQGLAAESLSFEEQLMACVDIYQALTEPRPYRNGMSHEESIQIMLDMARKGELNERVVQDMNTVMASLHCTADDTVDRICD